MTAIITPREINDADKFALENNDDQYKPTKLGCIGLEDGYLSREGEKTGNPHRNIEEEDDSELVKGAPFDEELREATKEECDEEKQAHG